MPRTYINRTDKGTTMEMVEGKKDSFESFMGNTNLKDINNPVTSFNFVLEVELLYFLAIKSLRAFTKENEYEYIREGGVNDYVHMKRKPISKPFTFQIERYVGNERFLDPLALGTELILPLILYVYRHKSRQGLFTDSAPANPARIYIFTGCTVISKEYGELNAERSGLLTETTTIAYRELIAITNPASDSTEEEEWVFNRENKGNTETKYAAYAKNDLVTNSLYPYKYVNDKDGTPHLQRKDDNPSAKNKEYRPQYELKKDGDKVKYAIPSPIDQAGGVYKMADGPDGRKELRRIDTVEYNKPAWTGAKNAKKWAKQSVPDTTNKTYETKTVDGRNVLVRVDGKPYNSPQYELKKNGAGNKYAKTSPTDKQKPVARPQYEMKKDQENVKYAKTSPRDKEKPVARPQYEMKKDQGNVKYANTSPRDKEKPKAMPQYELKKDMATPKYAQVSPKDKEKPEAVIWPPTRRALMAEALKK